MNFIKVHNIEGGDLLINIDKVATIYPRTAGGAVVNYFDGSTAPVTETVDELAALLLPGPVVVKELSPGVQERPKKAGPAIDDETAAKVIRDYYGVMVRWINRNCPDLNCDECPNKDHIFACSGVFETKKIQKSINLYFKAKAEGTES